MLDSFGLFGEQCYATGDEGTERMGGNRGSVTASGEGSVAVGGSVTDGHIVTGDQNMVSFTKITLPPAESVDIRAELAALRAALEALGAPDAAKIGRALDDAEEEASKAEPDKKEVGNALDRALDYAEKAEGFTAATEKLLPRVRAIAGWLGEYGPRLLKFVGLVI